MRFWKFIKKELEEKQDDIQNQLDDNKEEIQDQQTSDSPNSDGGQEETQQQASDSQGSEVDPEESQDQQTSDLQSSDGESEESQDQQASDSQSSDGESEESQDQQASDSQSSESEPEESQDQQASDSQSSDDESEKSQDQQTSDSQSSDGEPEESQDQQTSDSQSSDGEPEESQDQQISDSQSSDGEPEETQQQNDNPESQNDLESGESSELTDSEDECDNQSNESKEMSTKEITDDIQDDRLEQLQKLRDKLKEYADKKQQEEIEKQQLEKVHLPEQSGEVTESKEEDYELSEQANQFLEQLGELPSFKDRDRGAGYSIDTESYTEIPDSMIRTLITKFLNQRFCKHNTDLNVRSNSLEKSRGFYKWEVKDVITHLKTHQITKVLDDKYGYEYANGKNENVPLSFYFDMSGSMSEYTNMLAVIAIELLKKGVKVLIGFNEHVNVQIDSITKNISVKELAEILESAGFWSWNEGMKTFKRDPRVTFKFVDKNIDNYLLSRKAEKCVVFSDFDPLDEVINLSNGAQVYWFCFESEFDLEDVDKFNGFLYQTQTAYDIMQGLIKVNENRFETLCYIESEKGRQKKLGGIE